MGNIIERSDFELLEVYNALQYNMSKYPVENMYNFIYDFQSRIVSGELDMLDIWALEGHVIDGHKMTQEVIGAIRLAKAWKEEGAISKEAMIADLPILELERLKL